MNKKIIIFIIIFVLIIIVGIVSYFLFGKTTPPASTPPVSTPPSSTSNTTVNATCRIGGVGGKSVQPGSQTIIDENEDNHYSFTNSVSRLGSVIKDSIEGFMFPERFTLTSVVIPNKNSLDNNKWYETGVLDPAKQIVAVTSERNGGTPCGSFPTKVYREAPPCPLASKGQFRNASGDCVFPACLPPNSTRNTITGDCICNSGYKNLSLGRDLNCQPDCPTNSTLIPGGWNNTGICQCKEGFQKAPGRTGDRDPCFQSCQSGWDMQSDGTCKYREINWGLQCPDGSSVAYNPYTNETYCQSNIYDETDTRWKYSITG